YGVGAWSTAKYTIKRGDFVFDLSVIVTGQSQRLKRQRLYVEIIGLFNFLVGVFILVRKIRAPQAIHFYYICLVSFVLFVYSYTGQLNLVDWTVFWLDLAASALLPPLFLHFCLGFAVRKNWFIRNGYWLILLYMPGFVILLAWLFFVT